MKIEPITALLFLLMDKSPGSESEVVQRDEARVMMGKMYQGKTNCTSNNDIDELFYLYLLTIMKYYLRPY